MPRDILRYLDVWSWVVILITFVMFFAALFIKGLGHDLLLEGGVFLVSVKLIMMAYRNSVNSTKLNERLDGFQNTLARIEAFLDPSGRSEVTEGPPNKAPQPASAARRGDDAEQGSRARG